MHARSFWSGAGVGLAAAGALGGALAAWILWGGAFDARASTPHIALVGWAAHEAMTASVAKRAGASPTRGFTATQVLEGAHLYRARCSACHGGPGEARAPWVSGMLPTPPYLVDAARHWTAGQLHEVVDHGVKMTGMPAWGEVEPPGHIWSLVAFLEALPSLTPSQYRAMTAEPPSVQAVEIGRDVPSVGLAEAQVRHGVSRNDGLGALQP